MSIINSIKRKLKKAKYWETIYEVDRCIVPLNYGYASTVHSAQGMSVKYLFIDFTDLHKLNHILSKTTIARLIYVAISRASHKVFIRGQIPYNLQGVFQ